jgi:hypothetical protein
MYADAWILFAIYFIAVLALAVSVYAVWSLEEIRQYYKKRSNQKASTYTKVNASIPLKKKSQAKGHFDH